MKRLVCFLLAGKAWCFSHGLYVYIIDNTKKEENPSNPGIAAERKKRKLRKMEQIFLAEKQGR
ncbi:MAG: hypothetical protein PUC36_05660 [Clostridiales bacterium]|nr:hypothetical protein [Clostridiales bacterium]